MHSGTMRGPSEKVFISAQDCAHLFDGADFSRGSRSRHIPILCVCRLLALRQSISEGSAWGVHIRQTVGMQNQSVTDSSIQQRKTPELQPLKW